jgi:hypothetical protein
MMCLHCDCIALWSLKQQDHVYLMIDGTAEVVSGDGDTLGMHVDTAMQT